jgi:methylmalonyl-CoA mutase C-terminal domain/subunit
MTIFPKILDLLKAQGADDVLLTGGGIIPKQDVAELEKLGTGRLFGPGSPIEEFAAYIREEVGKRRAR